MTDDILLVQINPLERRQTPRTAPQIHNRLNEITFNATLLRELRAVAFVTRLIEEEGAADEYKNVHLHRIDASGVLDDHEASSKGNAEWITSWRFAMPGGTPLNPGSRPTTQRSAYAARSICRTLGCEPGQLRKRQTVYRLIPNLRASRRPAPGRWRAPRADPSAVA